VRTFAALYDIPLALVKALAMVLNEQPSHQAKQTQFQFDTWLNNLTEAEKDTLLGTLFEQGQLTRHRALALTRKESANTDEIYQYWLTPEVISPFIEQAQEQADRTCASGYDVASRYLHQLNEAYQFKGDPAFEQRFKRFVAYNSSRKALLNRLSDLL
jgi:hypothetical protein